MTTTNRTPACAAGLVDLFCGCPACAEAMMLHDAHTEDAARSRCAAEGRTYGWTAADDAALLAADSDSQR
jgi:uncharacterized protein (DUF983 family)